MFYQPKVSLQVDRFTRIASGFVTCISFLAQPLKVNLSTCNETSHSLHSSQILFATTPDSGTR